MKRVTLFCGHYGSGKTNLAVNYALSLRRKGLEVSLADLDIVNPYFRSKDSADQLEEAGVRVIALPFANSSVDLPSLPSSAYSLVQNRSRYAVLDIGGDDRGAYALGRFDLPQNCQRFLRRCRQRPVEVDHAEHVVVVLLQDVRHEASKSVCSPVVSAYVQNRIAGAVLNK